MANKSGPPAVLFIVIFLILAAVGYWFFNQKLESEQAAPVAPQAPPGELPPAPPPAPTASESQSFSLPASVPADTTIAIDGSTSMVTINQNLKRGFQQQYPGTTVATIANGTDRGIESLLSGNSDIAAISRALTPQEQEQGLAAIAIASDRIAIVVGAENPYRRGLNREQIRQIFQGEITDWSQLGGQPGQIQAINRPPISGTHQAFQELALKGGNFGNTPNIKTMPRDETTGLLRELGSNGIGYATYAQVVNQQTVRVVAIDGMTPEAQNYPFQRVLYYAYKTPPNPAVQYFLGYATSPQGQQAMLYGN